MNVVQVYNNLAGSSVYRHQLRTLANEAKRQGYTAIASKLFSILSNDKQTQVFEIGTVKPMADYIPSGALAGLDLDPYNETESGLGKYAADDVYKIINEHILKAIKKHGDAPWRKGWAGGAAMNYVSKKAYRGVNAVLMNYVYPRFVKNYKYPYWITFKQANDLGARVKKGESGFQVLFYSWLYSYFNKEKNLEFRTTDRAKFKRWLIKNNVVKYAKVDTFADLHAFAMPKYYTVFNVAQLEDIEVKSIGRKTDGFTINTIAECIIKNYPPKKPTYKESGKDAYYSPSQDLVNMPPRELFNSEEEFYSTLFHEYIHSTSGKGRLKRPTGSIFGSKKYAAEELVAEIGAVYLSAEAGFMFHTVNNAASYIKSWSKKLTDAIEKDNKFFIRACSHAQKAADYILQPDKKNGTPKYYKDLKKPAKTTPKKETAKPTPKKRSAAKKPKKQQLELFEMSGLNGVGKNLAGMGFVSASETPNIETFLLPGEIGKFLQTIQAYKELILIKGTKHTSKSQLAMQIANAFGELKMPVGYIDQEQGGMLSKDTVDSRNRNTSLKGRQYIFIKGDLENPLAELEKYCQFFKVIVADSVTELGISADELNYLRTKYPDVIWIFISQVKENGNMYGGNKMAHNPTKIIECHPNIDPKKRYASLEKNRGNNLDVYYSMYEQKIIENPQNQTTE